MHVAILIVAYRNADDVARCLEAVGRSTHRDFEVVVCENGGQEAFAELRRRMPNVLEGGQRVAVYCANGNLGFAGGVNFCLRQAADANAWWVLNPDTEPRPEALAFLVERLQLGDCDAVGCALYLPDGRIQSYGGRWQPWLARSVSLGFGAPMESSVDEASVEARQTYLNGASMLISRRFLETVGEMREDYFLYCEETEWFLRGAKLGLRLGFASRALVLHAQGTTTGAGGEVRRRPKLPIYLDERNKMLLSRDHFPARLPVAAVASLVQLLFRYGRRGAWRQFGYGLEGWAAGLMNERGRPWWSNG